MSIDIQNSPICIIYFAYINPDPRKNWRNILNGQMDDLIRCGVLSQSSLEIVLSGTPELTEQAQSYLESILSSYIYKTFTIVHENNFEYEGMKRLYNLGQEYPDKIFLYFHSKGMVYYEVGQSRLWLEQMLTRITLTKWEDVLFIFGQYSDINKIGCYPANNEGSGCIWFNFFWVRGSYLKTCTEPQITSDRYYYEYWLGESGNKSLNDAYSLICKNRNRLSRCDVLYSLVDMETKERTYGYFDIPAMFDWRFYINKYDDLKNVLNTEAGARQHYHFFGIFENRQYCDIPDEFDWRTYIVQNDDLRNHMICTKEDAIFHYKMFGHKENRIFFSIPEEFDSTYYLHLYEDLRNAGIQTRYDAARHYFNFGRSENRVMTQLPSEFDWNKYVSKYEDLSQAGITTKKRAIDHYINYGRHEGRTWD